MKKITMPELRPGNPCYSSGPCAKRPNWSLEALKDTPFGRSHRAKIGKAKLKEAIDLTKEILKIPQDYRVAIVPASDTGAVEMSLWSLLGERGVDILAWESFGAGWVTDVVKQLKLSDVRRFEADYGHLPDLTELNFNRDVVFTWNGTTSGVRLPNADFIPTDRKGLTICDATSAAFAVDLDFTKLDVTTFSWQKVLGGEGAHGMLVLSPRAVERLESYVPAWPLPKIFRMTKGGKLIEGLFEGATINTPSMLCVEDYLDALKWGKKLGGLEALIQRANKNAEIIHHFVAENDWIANLAIDPKTQSNTSVCLKIVDPEITKLTPKEQADFAKRIAALLEKEKIAFDIGAYRDAPAGLRIWTGATIETSDLKALMPWLSWAYETQKAALSA
ncbi:phosphoserine transaminase [Acetobacteraceae bacterium]|nr:phosphoserine transaminase [Acetobacteraceae bacterium]